MINDILSNINFFSVDEKSGRIDLSLKKSVVDPDFKVTPQITFASLEVGQKLVGVVSKIEKYGVFVRIDNSKRISGLCHVSEVTKKINTKIILKLTFFLL